MLNKYVLSNSITLFTQYFLSLLLAYNNMFSAISNNSHPYIV
jgi:hypothetical protein